jgi:hypothetical protein
MATSAAAARPADPAFQQEIHALACGKAYIAVLKHVREGGGGDLKALFDAHYRETMTKAGVEPLPSE